MKILITGGAGYIGSTVALACADAGHRVVVLDDFSTGRPEFSSGFSTYCGDVSDRRLLEQIITEHPDINTVLHCAAKIIVHESVVDPMAYYHENVAKTVDMLRHLCSLGLRRVVFSSSASVYASGNGAEVTETSPTEPATPYARTKLMVEQILADASAAGLIDALVLRYFNPVGADPQLRTGSALAQPSHLMGQLLNALDSGASFSIFGSDWPSRDGTAIRDFVHVLDLARAHVAAIEAQDDGRIASRFDVLNVGTGRGTSVRELVDAFTKVSGQKLSFEEAGRRMGDTLGSYAGVAKIESLTGWRSELSVEDCVRDALRWRTRRKEWLGY